MFAVITNSTQHLFRSVRSALENGSDIWGDDETPFGLVNSAEQIWEWLQGPVVDLAYTDANNTCVRDKGNGSKMNEAASKRLGHIALAYGSKCRLSSCL